MGRLTTMWWADLVYSLLILGGLFLFALTEYQGGLAFLFGAIIGYIIRTAERMAVFEDMLSQTVEEEVEETAEEHVQEEVPEQIEEEIEKQVEEIET